MSRKKRIWYPGATYHVMSRGNRRTTLFKEQSDYMRFLECVAISRKQYSFRIHVCFKKNEIFLNFITIWGSLEKRMIKE